MSVYRSEFVEALHVFASVSDAVASGGFERPVLVGGAAVELYSSGRIATGDFDVVTGRQDRFEAELRRHGFERAAGPGHVESGWIHPDLKIGFEVVGAALLDGMADRNRVLLLDASSGRFAVIAVEDLIADRMGQYASGAAPDMLEQAAVLFRLYQTVDHMYLDRRIREETAGDYGFADLQP